MADAGTGPEPQTQRPQLPAQLVELRSYTLVPGAADPFARHFEEHLVAGQEELGMDLVGRFQVPGDDARFVWVRRYLEPPNRGAALAAFYGGPVWEEFGPRANELMVDFSDVHLLAPDPSSPPFAANHVPLARRDGQWVGDMVVAATFDRAVAAGSAPAHGGLVEAMDEALAASPTGEVTELGRLVTAHVPNDFPRLPVHEDVDVAVWLLSDRTGGAHSATALAREVATATHLPLRTVTLRPTPDADLR
jgi:hypothetical protein